MPDTEGKADNPFFGNLFIEEIVKYHKVKPKPTQQRTMLLTVANLAGGLTTFSTLRVGGTFRCAAGGSPGGFDGNFDVTVSWSSINLEKFLNFDGCLYYQQQGPIGQYIFPRYNDSWQSRYIEATVNGVPLTVYDPAIQGYRPVNSHDVATPFFELVPGQPFSASATCSLGTVMLGWTFLNPNWAPPQPRIVGYADDYGYIFAAMPRYLFVPLTQGGASISNMVCPTVDSVLGDAGLTPYLPTITSNGDGTTSTFDPTTAYPPFNPPP